MRLVFISTHVDQITGYSKVAYNMLRQLATLTPKVKVFHFGFQRHPSRPLLRKYPEGIVSYDAAANEDPKEEGFGFNKIHDYLEMVGPDIVMIYNDAFVICKFLEAMKHERGKSPYKLWLYLDQVYHGIAPPMMDAINRHADRIYCFTETWKKALLRYGPGPEVQVLEHAVDPTVFSNMPPEARKPLRAGVNIPENAIVFLNANRNSQRKRLDLTIMGFVRLLSRDPSRPYYLMLVTAATPQGGAYYDLQRIFIEELVRHKLDAQAFAARMIVVDTSPGANVISDEAINQLYNITDIGINTSDGEGYGLCQLEHLYTGAPQVVTNVGGYSDFLPSTVATYIPEADRIYFSGTMPLGLWSSTFTVESVADAMDRVVQSLPEYKSAANAHEFKSWSTVCDQFLEDLITLASGDQVAIVSVPVKS